VTPSKPTLAELAEEPDFFIAEPPLPARRIILPRATIVFSPSPSQSGTSHVRTTEAELDDTIAEVRRTLREAGYVRNVWHVGPSCRPAGLGAMLRARGFVPATLPPYEATATAMALGKAPAIAPSSHRIEARLVRDVDEYRQVMRIAMAAFNEPPEAIDSWMEAVPALWAAHDGVNRYTHMAFLDGRPVGFGFAATCGDGVLLGGSGVLEDARGHGVYRALVAGRWDEARRLGKAGLIIHAGSMSRPILEKCGFETVCEIDVLEDATFNASQGG